MANLDLLSATSRVEAPFISATIAGKTFGVYNKKQNTIDNSNRVDYPNFMQSLDIVKMNNHNLYKDRIRTWELQARVALKK